MYCGSIDKISLIKIPAISGCPQGYSLTSNRCIQTANNCDQYCGFGSTCTQVKNMVTCTSCGPGSILNGGMCVMTPNNCNAYCRHGSTCRFNDGNILCTSCGEGKKLRHSKCTEEWSSWRSWSKCSQLCGGGKQSRTRYCGTPEFCEGSDSEEQACNTASCLVDCSWCEWSTPILLEGECGKQRRVRNRTPSCPPVSGGGRECEGSSTD